MVSNRFSSSQKFKYLLRKSLLNKGFLIGRRHDHYLTGQAGSRLYRFGTDDAALTSRYGRDRSPIKVSCTIFSMLPVS